MSSDTISLRLPRDSRRDSGSPDWIVLIPLSAVPLGVAHYLAYRRARPGQWRQRVLLWTATVLSISFWVVPATLR